MITKITRKKSIKTRKSQSKLEKISQNSKKSVKTVFQRHLGYLHRLEILDVQHNELIGLPHSICKLRSLRVLLVSNSMLLLSKSWILSTFNYPFLA